jgi:hypothetical protein
MAFKVRFLKDFGVVETIWSGQVSPGDIDEGVTATGILAAEKLCNRSLVDLREQGAGRLGTRHLLAGRVPLLAAPRDDRARVPC